MKHLIPSIAVVMLCLSPMSSSLLWAQRAQGNSGADVGSSAWFEQEETKTARRLGLTPREQVGFVSVLGQFVFTKGNRFPGGQLPELQIRCVDQMADGAERGPSYINQQGQTPYFFTRLKRGQTYKFGWLYYLGTKDQFGTWSVPENAPKRIRLVIYYESAKGMNRFKMSSPDEPVDLRSADSPSSSAQPEISRRSNAPPVEAERNANPRPPHANLFDLSGVPDPPTTFEEQQLLQLRRHDGTSWYDHEKLAQYYEKRRDLPRAKAEDEKAKFWKSGGR